MSGVPDKGKGSGGKDGDKKKPKRVVTDEQKKRWYAAQKAKDDAARAAYKPPPVQKPAPAAPAFTFEHYDPSTQYSQHPPTGRPPTRPTSHWYQELPTHNNEEPAPRNQKKHATRLIEKHDSHHTQEHPPHHATPYDSQLRPHHYDAHNPHPYDAQQPPQQQPAPISSIPNASQAPARAHTWDLPPTQAGSSRQSTRQQPRAPVSQNPPPGQFTQQAQPPRAFQQPPPRLELGYAEEYAPHHPQGYVPRQTATYGSQQDSHPYDASRPGYDARRAFPETPRQQQTASDSDPYAAVTQPLETLYITPRPIREPTYQATPMGATTANPSGRPRHSPPSEDDDTRPTRRRNTGDTEGKQPPRKSNMRSLLHHTPSPPSQN